MVIAIETPLLHVLFWKWELWQDLILTLLWRWNEIAQYCIFVLEKTLFSLIQYHILSLFEQVCLMQIVEVFKIW